MVYLFYALAALKVWMLVDAIQRGASCYWYAIIVCVPFGSVIYFFVVKGPEFGIGSGMSRYRPIRRRATPRSLDALRHLFRENPCLDHEAELAAALFDAELYTESETHYRGVLARDEQYSRARYGLALCRIAQGDHRGAIAQLETLLAQDRGYADYRAWFELADCLGSSGQSRKRVACLGELVAASPRLDHSLALADALVEADRSDEARETLARALQDYEHAPPHVKRLAGASAKRASRMLGQLA